MVVNVFRSVLSQGYVRNGKVGKPNLPPARNMLTMKYDFSLENDAQAYADKCSLVGSGPNSGENTHVIQSTSVTALDAFKQSMRTWWEQISSTSVGSCLKYTTTLEEKKNPLTSFTQMAWAETYKVGCGIKRCFSETFVVCRYDPPGNILGKTIYKQGAICATCRSNCIAALCPTPEN
ncbi:SCP-like protein [Necator americanus]|uniref:SCP-like protein n=1 Tax=Necator americanus TaxID=51031 RepID=W2TYS0_NECAM|nr:SCP-like protein [Necator americanus]ETN86182.1 SCP-like protein [Necator americanus]